MTAGLKSSARSDGEWAALLDGWVGGLEQSFADRILPIDIPIARGWGMLSSDRSRPVIDTLLAATAVIRGMILVTPNA